MEKLSSMKLVPSAKRVGDHCYRDKGQDNVRMASTVEAMPTSISQLHLRDTGKVNARTVET